jgi:hypothetical protein
VVDGWPSASASASASGTGTLGSSPPLLSWDAAFDCGDVGSFFAGYGGSAVSVDLWWWVCLSVAWCA